ncbi:MAG: acyl carrier protein [Clostridiales bacterium]|nr:acyl carrier protein [Clostridiales bacterium]
MNLDQVRDVIAETLGCNAEDVTAEAKLREDLGADSLAAVELMMALEEATGVSIEDEAMPGMQTVGDIVTYLEAHQG